MKTHLHDPEATASGRALRRSLCGMLAVVCTDDTDEVTCKLCLREAHRRYTEGKRSRVSKEEAIRDLAAVVAGLKAEPQFQVYPHPLTPDLWHSMRCRTGHLHCSCKLCQIDDANVRIVASWYESQQLRPHRRYECPFGSLNAALEHLLRWMQDGASARSSQGSLQSRAQETSALGTHVQTTIRTDRESIELRKATQAADIEAACLYAYREEAQHKGLGARLCVGVLLDSVDPAGAGALGWAEHLDMSEASVREVISHGRKVASERLVAAGYIPEPRAVRPRQGRGTSMRVEVDA